MFTNPIENPLGRKGLKIYTFNDNFSGRSQFKKEYKIRKMKQLK